jgi:signal transduction histidine kinase
MPQERRAREDERRQIAAELHDYPMQDLVAAILGIELARMHDDPAEHQHCLEVCEKGLRNAAQSLRRMMEGLAPLDQEHASLDDRISELCTWITNDYGVPITVSTSTPEIATLSANTAYRAIAESLRNIGKHADAHSVQVSTCAEADNLRVVIVDDGAGFPHPISCEDMPPIDFGTGMRLTLSRILEIGGHYRIASTPGVGTASEFVIPVESMHSLREI